jgi:hypothetical protein
VHTFRKATLGAATLALVALALLAGGSPATASSSPAISFGRSGGNIPRYTISITRDGRVTATGIAVGRHRLSRTTVDNLLRLSATIHFFRLSTATRCPQTLPDFASDWIHVYRNGHERLVRVRGDCVTGFTRLYRALTRAVALRQAANSTTFTFGRRGGNIIPYTVTIDPSGRVSATGITATKTQVSQTTLADLLQLADSVGFFAMATATACPRTSPDVAALEIHIQTGSRDRAVQVHGDCVDGFTKLYRALGEAVGLQT